MGIVLSGYQVEDIIIYGIVGALLLFIIGITSPKGKIRAGLIGLGTGTMVGALLGYILGIGMVYSFIDMFIYLYVPWIAVIGGGIGLFFFKKSPSRFVPIWNGAMSGILISGAILSFISLPNILLGLIVGVVLAAFIGKRIRVFLILLWIGEVIYITGTRLIPTISGAGFGGLFQGCGIAICGLLGLICVAWLMSTGNWEW